MKINENEQKLEIFSKIYVFLIETSDFNRFSNVFNRFSLISFGLWMVFKDFLRFYIIERLRLCRRPPRFADCRTCTHVMSMSGWLLRSTEERGVSQESYASGSL